MNEARAGKIEVNEERAKMGNLILKSTKDVLKKARNYNYKEELEEDYEILEEWLKTGDVGLIWYIYFQKIGFKKTLKYFSIEKKRITDCVQAFCTNREINKLTKDFEKGMRLFYQNAK